MIRTITMDSAGRIVLPKVLRDRMRLAGGDELRIEMVGDHLELTPVSEEAAPSVVRKKGLLVVSASGKPSDAVKAIEGVREDREEAITPERQVDP